MQPQQPHVFQQHPGAMAQQAMPATSQQGMAPPAAYRKRPSEADKHIKFVFSLDYYNLLT